MYLPWFDFYKKLKSVQLEHLTNIYPYIMDGKDTARASLTVPRRAL